MKSSNLVRLVLVIVVSIAVNDFRFIAATVAMENSLRGVYFVLQDTCRQYLVEILRIEKFSTGERYAEGNIR